MLPVITDGQRQILQSIYWHATPFKLAPHDNCQMQNMCMTICVYVCMWYCLQKRYLYLNSPCQSVPWFTIRLVVIHSNLALYRFILIWYKVISIRSMLWKSFQYNDHFFYRVQGHHYKGLLQPACWFQLGQRKGYHIIPCITSQQLDWQWFRAIAGKTYLVLFREVWVTNPLFVYPQNNSSQEILEPHSTDH